MRRVSVSVALLLLLALAQVSSAAIVLWANGLYARVSAGGVADLSDKPNFAAGNGFVRFVLPPGRSCAGISFDFDLDGPDGERVDTVGTLQAGLTYRFTTFTSVANTEALINTAFAGGACTGFSNTGVNDGTIGDKIAGLLFTANVPAGTTREVIFRVSTTRPAGPGLTYIQMDTATGTTVYLSFEGVEPPPNTFLCGPGLPPCESATVTSEGTSVTLAFSPIGAPCQ